MMTVKEHICPDCKCKMDHDIEYLYKCPKCDLLYDSSEEWE